MSEHSIPLGTRLAANVESLRQLLREYRQLPEADQKAARAGLYGKQGMFGRAMSNHFPEFLELEKKFEDSQATKLAAKQLAPKVQ